MRSITVTVKTREQTSRLSDPRLAFWNDYVREARVRTPGGEEVDDFAAEQEQRLRILLPEALHYRVLRAMYPGREGIAGPPTIQPAQLVMTVEAIRYGSMVVDLGLPDIDAFAELVGNNSDVLEALLGAYIPSAFEQVLSGDNSQLRFDVSIPADVRNRINSSKTRSDDKGESTPKERGSAIIVGLLRSPLLLPIILIFFLWYYARQDMVEDRRVTAGLMQTLVTEQTAVISLLKAKQDDDAKPKVAPGNSSVAPTTTTPPKPKAD